MNRSILLQSKAQKGYQTGKREMVHTRGIKAERKRKQAKARGASPSADEGGRKREVAYRSVKATQTNGLQHKRR